MNRSKKHIVFVVCVFLAMVLLLTSCGKTEYEPFETLQSSEDDSSNGDFLIHTVNFLDEDGTVLKMDSVENGSSATAPATPKGTGKTFLGWDRAFDCVEKDLTVSALYTDASDPTVIVVNQIASAKQTIKLPIVIVNNPGIAGAKLTVRYDSALTLTDSVCGEVFSMLDYMPSGRYDSPCNFTWDSESGMAMDDGEILVLTFRVSETVAPGDVYEISCSYRTGDVYDENLNDVNIEVINGKITIE